MSLLTEFEPAFTLDGALPSIITCYEAASQTFTQGQGLYGDQSEGTVKELAGNDPATENDVLGVASVDATGTTNTRCGVWVLDNRTAFKGWLADGGAPAQTEIWDLRQLAVDTGRHLVHESTGTLGHVMIIGIEGTTTSSRVYFIGGYASNATESGASWNTKQFVA